MTREEEIKAKSKEYMPDILDDEYPYKAEFVFGFQEGAKWADENPNSNGKELLYVAQKTAERTKNEVISKACEWLKGQLIDNQDNCGYAVVSTFDTTTVEEFICDFKKAMEL